MSKTNLPSSRELPRPSAGVRPASAAGSAGRAGCNEYGQWSRRRFLSIAGGALGASLLPAFVPRVALAADGGGRDVLVSIFLRGGADGLTLCVPHGDEAYYRLRPTLAIPKPDAQAGNRALDLDGFFGLPPALHGLAEPFRDGALAVVHACGLEGATRSHFDAMRFVEVGMGGAPFDLRTGWIARHLQTVPPLLGDGLLRAMALGYALPTSLAGAPAAAPVPDPATYGIPDPTGELASWQQRLWQLYERADEPMASSALTARSTIDLLDSVDVAGYSPSGGATYPEDELGQALRATAALVRAEIGLEAASIDFGGWDTHEAQGSVDGQMAALMTSLADGLLAFYRDLWSAGFERVVVVVQSEFGRNAIENGSLGTDHGHAGAMLVLGGGVLGGRVLGTWPGLEAEQLFEGQDLAITTDYRSVLAEILDHRLQSPDSGLIFDDPSFVPEPLGLFASSASNASMVSAVSRRAMGGARGVGGLR